MSSVLKSWVMNAGWKMQSILLSGLRAPDQKTDAVKRVCRWMRAVSQNNADPSKGYMEPQVLGRELADRCLEELEYLPCHYAHHFADALRVIGIYHPDREISAFANYVHEEIAREIFHFEPEGIPEFVARHRDKTDHE